MRSMQGLGSLIAVVLAATVVTFVASQSASPTPGVSKTVTPSPFSYGNYWVPTYHSAVLNIRGGSIGSRPASFFRMGDLPTGGMRWKEEYGTHGVIYGDVNTDISLHQSGDNALEGHAMKFLTPSGYAEAPLPNVNEGLSGFSMDFWIKVDSLSAATGTVIEIRDCSLNYYLTLEEGLVRWWIGAGYVQSQPDRLADGRFAHIALIVKAATVVTYQADLYVNGELQPGSLTLPMSSLVLSAGCMFRVGGSSIAGLYVDEVAIYDDVLSYVDVTARAYAGNNVPCLRQPCFSGVTCTAVGTGLNSYVCGTCPPGFSGDGKNCTANHGLADRVGCFPNPAQSLNSSYCSLTCSSRVKCYFCSLKMQGSTHIQSRLQCKLAVETHSIADYTKLGPLFPTALCTKKVFTYTGALQTFTVPANVFNINTKVWGAGGGGGHPSSSKGGNGGFSYGSIAVRPGDVLYVMVGGGGVFRSSSATFGGGGSGSLNALGSSGGGLSGVFRSNVSQIAALIVAGGGGGASYSDSNRHVTAGNGGGSTGSNAASDYAFGAGGSSTSGGSGGTGTAIGISGSALTGGGGRAYSGSGGGGGGGGGGYFGGGGGGDQASQAAGAGGGGSGYVHAAADSPSLVQGTNSAPPMTSDSDYIPGTGVGGAESVAGGHGLVVFSPGSNCNCLASLGFGECNPGLSCQNIKNSNSSAVSGFYWIKPYTATGAFMVHCDMSTSSGGWTLTAVVGNADGDMNWKFTDFNGNNGDLNSNWENFQYFGNLSNYNSPADFKSPAYFGVRANEILIKFNGLAYLRSGTTCLGNKSLKEYFNALRFSSAGSSYSCYGSCDAGFSDATHSCPVAQQYFTSSSETSLCNGGTASALYLKAGEANGAQDSNKDRVYISTNLRDNVDYTLGIGAYTLYSTGPIVEDLGTYTDTPVRPTDKTMYFQIYVR